MGTPAGSPRGWRQEVGGEKVGGQRLEVRGWKFEVRGQSLMADG
jgi:hypothetical protein